MLAAVFELDKADLFGNLDSTGEQPLFNGVKEG
jgi:hypothetical protein